MPDDLNTGRWVFDPDTLSALRLEKAHNALSSGDPHRAMVEAEELLEDFPHHLEALTVVGRAALDMGDAHVALSAWTKVREALPDDIEALVGITAARFELTDLPACETAALRLQQLAPERAEGWYYQGLCHSMRGELEPAKQAFTQAQDRDPERYPVPVKVGERTWRLSLTKAMASLPSEVQAFYHRVPVGWQNLPPVERLRALEPCLSPFLPILLDGELLNEEEERPRPDRVWLFRDNLAWPPPRPGELVDRIRHAMLVEAVHWLGIEPDETWLTGP